VQIFCDESGGVDGDHFLVAAITVADSCATRIVKTFKKAVKMSSEIKGHSLSETDRRIFFDILNKEGDALAIVVHCGRSSVVGGWAMRGLKEIVLYGHLISEACTPIIKSASVPSIQISPDGGRYKKSESEELRKILHRTFSGAFGSETKLKVAFQSSHDSAGIQIADVIANTVYQYQSGSGSAALCGEITSNLIALERLELRTVQLEVIRPAWMPADTQKEGSPLADDP
jgi:hypothetical protein